MRVGGFAILGILVVSLFSCASMQTRPQTGLTDGKYSGESQSKYQAEPYWGVMSFTVKNNRIKNFDFKIMDRQRNIPFDAKYDSVFTGNDEYMQQCRNDWNGMQAYIKAFLATGDIAKVDAITGATWPYNLFKDSYGAAVKK